MGSNIRRAFTLIELLVVIAIIAILAAILFPVFAQAKAAAKASVALSQCREMGIGQLMYMGDNDDAFSPVSEFDLGDWAIKPFSFLQQPYMKDWGVVMDPLSPAKLDSDPMVIRSQWAMAPLRAATISTSPADYTMGRSAQGKAFTGGNLYYFEGIAGVAYAENSVGTNWAAWNYKPGNTPSLSATSVQSPADMIMICQSGTYDMMWQFANWGDGPDNWDRYWAQGIYNLYGDNDMIGGPMARVRAQGADAGWIPIGSEPTATLPKGNTIYVACDGHAKNVAWRGLMGTTVPIAGGNVAIKAFWPN